MSLFGEGCLGHNKYFKRNSNKYGDMKRKSKNRKHETYVYSYFNLGPKSSANITRVLYGYENYFIYISRVGKELVT